MWETYKDKAWLIVAEGDKCCLVALQGGEERELGLVLQSIKMDSELATKHTGNVKLTNNSKSGDIELDCEDNTFADIIMGTFLNAAKTKPSKGWAMQQWFNILWVNHLRAPLPFQNATPPMEVYQIHRKDNKLITTPTTAPKARHGVAIVMKLL